MHSRRVASDGLTFRWPVPNVIQCLDRLSHVTFSVDSIASDDIIGMLELRAEGNLGREKGGVSSDKTGNHGS